MRIPLEIWQSSALQELCLTDNQLSTLPAELGQLSALQVLYLDNNPLQPPLREIMTQGIPVLLAYLRTMLPIKIFYCYVVNDLNVAQKLP
jgi:Leucine-rich repeat (LRR) protein